MSRFRSLWVAYHAQFTEWKRSSANYLTDELVAAYLELEAPLSQTEEELEAPWAQCRGSRQGSEV